MAEPTTVGMMVEDVRMGPLTWLGFSGPVKTILPQVKKPAARDLDSGSLR